MIRSSRHWPNTLPNLMTSFLQHIVSPCCFSLSHYFHLFPSSEIARSLMFTFAKRFQVHSWEWPEFLHTQILLFWIEFQPIFQCNLEKKWDFKSRYFWQHFYMLSTSKTICQLSQNTRIHPLFSTFSSHLCSFNSPPLLFPSIPFIWAAILTRSQQAINDLVELLDA